ncbi:hypothetical protein EVB41_080 [Rhizobium phage RHph_TM3_14A]|nr:hypothetical protein EVB31_079 [Rhizobium phage RHph_TM29]QIG67545.1 hypothetical protein EVB41_080 [Rhizobium phage RHph_TM3_14A]
MADGVIGQALQWLVEQGAGGVVAVLIGYYAILLDKRVQARDVAADKAAEEANAKLQDMYEKRLNEFREILDVMSNSTNTVTAMHSSLTASTDAINQLAAGFATLLHEFHAQQARWDDRRGAMAKQLDDIQQRIESLQRGHGGRVA